MKHNLWMSFSGFLNLFFAFSYCKTNLMILLSFDKKFILLFKMLENVTYYYFSYWKLLISSFISKLKFLSWTIDCNTLSIT